MFIRLAVFAIRKPHLLLPLGLCRGDDLKIGFLTYDLQPFTEDCLFRVSQGVLPHVLKAFPVIFHRNQGNVRFDFLPSQQQGRFFGVYSTGATPEGFARNLNLRAAWRCAVESDIVVLFGLQGASALVAAALAIGLRKPIISVNQTLPKVWEERRIWWVRLAKRLLLALCSIHIAQSYAAIEVLSDVYHVPGDRIVFAPFEAGAALFREHLARARELPRPVAPRSPDLTTFLFVGNLHSFKGLEVLLRAVGRCRDLPIHCVVVGREEPRNKAGGTRDYYLALAAELGVTEKCEFISELSHDRLAQLYGCCDVVVLPTLKDCFPKVLVEGALAALPLITTTANGCAGSLVRDGDTGYLVEPGDDHALAEAMKKLLNRELRVEMGARAYAAVSELCSPELETAGFKTAIERAVSERSR
jgi:glycosyltransferase involved in cell wall biosynthesis